MEKAKSGTANRSVVSRDWGGKRELTAERQRRTFWGDVYIPYLHCSTGGMTVDICQKSSKYRERQILYGITYMWDLKKIQLVNRTKKKQTPRYREQTRGYQWGQGRGRCSRGLGEKQGYYGII